MAEKRLTGALAICAPEATRGIDAENEGDDRTAEKDGEDHAEVLLEIFLDPGNHGEKPPTLGRRTELSMGESRRGTVYPK